MTWLDTREAAQHAGCHIQTIRAAAAAGELHGYQRKAPKGKWRFDSGCVDAWVTGEPCAHRSNVRSLRAS